MQLTHQKRGRYLLIDAQGRLDATWADYFTDALMSHVRDGHHDLILDASGMAFLSSAGIRALLKVYKELIAVQGSFRIVGTMPIRIAPKVADVDGVIRATHQGVSMLPHTAPRRWALPCVRRSQAGCQTRPSARTYG